ncbi:hypothetical protein [Streptomyces sp. XD-27]|uniref:DUF7848 domain-containing protein n=1 Tax=Streptomyces sp. XD-27 TaxID=3062779 RepID=UPI0026F46E77|nr:hypothetical protein [Streptomyces sp. XD-27]WKX72688.1 hypothetical protein Q3Y56_24760 [Streptomyces sp. XD-27]
MDHTVIKGAEWMLGPETAEGAPQGIYGAQCITCAQESGLVDDDTRPVGAWAIAHTRENPTHRQFLVTTHRHWRVDPTPPTQPPEPTPEPEPTHEPPRLPRSHAKPPRTPRLPPALRLAARRVLAYSGVLYLLGMSLACGAAVALSLATG